LGAFVGFPLALGALCLLLLALSCSLGIGCRFLSFLGAPDRLSVSLLMVGMVWGNVVRHSASLSGLH